MPDNKMMTELPTTTTIVGADLLMVTQDIASSAITRAILVSDFFGSIPVPMLLPNNEWIMGRNAADDANMFVLKLNANDQIAIGGALKVDGATVILTDAVNFDVNVNTGTKWGTAPEQKQAWYGAMPVTQPAGIVDADGSLADVTNKLNSLLAKLESLGFLGVA